MMTGFFLEKGIEIIAFAIIFIPAGYFLMKFIRK